jgi:predicted regulator of amino acid metabolism with ACT domain
MNNIKLYIEFYGPVRRPIIDVKFNNQLLSETDSVFNRVSDYQENAVLNFSTLLESNNLLQVIMSDKTNADMRQIDDRLIDHRIVIREIDVDGIKFNNSLQNSCVFEHNMPDDWVSAMERQGYLIKKITEKTTNIAMNGTWSINFSTPIWLWCTQRLTQ